MAHGGGQQGFGRLDVQELEGFRKVLQGASDVFLRRAKTQARVRELEEIQAIFKPLTPEKQTRQSITAARVRLYSKPTPARLEAGDRLGEVLERMPKGEEFFGVSGLGTFSKRTGLPGTMFERPGKERAFQKVVRGDPSRFPETSADRFYSVDFSIGPEGRTTARVLGEAAPPSGAKPPKPGKFRVDYIKEDGSPITFDIPFSGEGLRVIENRMAVIDKKVRNRSSAKGSKTISALGFEFELPFGTSSWEEFVSGEASSDDVADDLVNFAGEYDALLEHRNLLRAQLLGGGPEGSREEPPARAEPIRARVPKKNQEAERGSKF